MQLRVRLGDSLSRKRQPSGMQVMTQQEAAAVLVCMMCVRVLHAPGPCVCVLAGLFARSRARSRACGAVGQGEWARLCGCGLCGCACGPWAVCDCVSNILHGACWPWAAGPCAKYHYSTSSRCSTEYDAARDVRSLRRGELSAERSASGHNLWTGLCSLELSCLRGVAERLRRLTRSRDSSEYCTVSA